MCLPQKEYWRNSTKHFPGKKPLKNNKKKILEFFTREVEELAELVVVGLELDLDELEDEGAACANVVAAWEEISADEGFEDAGFVTALAVDDNNLGEVDGGLTSDAGKDVLKAIHQGDHARTKRSSSSRCFCRRRDLVRHDRWIEP
ncbi:hypothetical protein GYH30_041944 [Glycine max]|nr:hypothetical protein GYH30_041944 [Glycine max]